MAIAEQLARFNAFAERLAETEGDGITIDHVIDRWWDEQHRGEDLAAIQASVEDYKRGERGEPAREELARHRADRQSKKTS